MHDRHIKSVNKLLLILSISLLLSLLLIPFAFAAVLHEGWHYSGEDFSVGGDDYSFMHEYGEDKILLVVNGKSTLLKLNKCIDEPEKEICFTEMDDSLDSDDVKYSGGQILAAIKMKITETGPDISISRSASATEMGLGDSVTVTATIANNGNRPADYFEYYDIFPEQLHVLESDPKENKYTKTGSLLPGQSRDLTYTLKAEDFADFVSQGNLTYTYNGIETSILTSSLNFVVNAPYEIDIDLDKSKILLGEEALYELTVKNIEEEDMEVKNLEIDAGDTNPISIDDKLKKNIDKFFWNGFLDPDEELDFRIRFKPEKIGSYKIKAAAFFRHKEKDYTYSDEQALDISIKGMDANLDLTPNAIISGSQLKVEGTVKNEDEIQLRIVEASVGIFGKKYDIGKLSIQPGKETILFDTLLEAPEVNSQSSYTVAFQGKYLTPKGNLLTFSEEDTVIVSPRSDSLKITIDAPATGSLGTDPLVKVKVKNLLEKRITVDIEEEFPFGILRVYGASVATLDLKPGEEVEAYSYRFRIPVNYEENEILLTTNAQVAGEKITATGFSVVSVVEAPEDEAETTEETIPLEKESGFFGKIWDSVDGFFDWLLG